MKTRDGMRGVLAASVLLAFAAFAGATDTVGGTDGAAFISTRSALDAHLAGNPASPINALSPGARERFLASLRFGEVGLNTMDPTDLADELDDAQIHAVLALFGERVLAYAPASRAEETSRYDRRASKNTGIGAVERQYNDFYIATKELTDPEPEVRSRKQGEIFDSRLAALYTPAALRRIDDHELRLLRRAARNVAIVTRLPRHVDAFDRVFAERTRRHLVSTDDVESLRDLYLALRRFREARALVNGYRDAQLPPLPQFEDSLGDAAGRATMWRMDESGRRMTRTVADLAPLQIVVTAACHLSKDAARDISNDALLGPVFEKHAQWLVPAPGRESIQAVREWNSELPRAPVAMVYEREEWSMLPHWNMPTFFIVRDGKVIDSASGWQTGLAETRDQLIATLKRNALLPAQ